MLFISDQSSLEPSSLLAFYCCNVPTFCNSVVIFQGRSTHPPRLSSLTSSLLIHLPTPHATRNMVTIVIGCPMRVHFLMDVGFVTPTYYELRDCNLFEGGPRFPKKLGKPRPPKCQKMHLN